MWNPEAYYPRTSFIAPVVDPGTAPGDDPLICIRVNASWIPYVLGSLMQLAQPKTWTTTEPLSLTDLLGRVTDLIALVGTAGACVAPELQLTTDGLLQLSLDGGTTWATVPGWVENMPDLVHDDQARVTMDPAYASPPIPEQITDGSDWLYSDHGEG